MNDVEIPSVPYEPNPTLMLHTVMWVPGINLGMGSANKRRRDNVMSYPTGWDNTQYIQNIMHMACILVCIAVDSYYCPGAS